MASLIPSGSASGTGSITLTTANTNSNQTATLPDATGTVMVSGAMPTFKANRNPAQSLTGSTYNKVLFNVEEWDTANCFDTSTSRFTPNVAGYYYFTLAIAAGGAGSIYLYPCVYKNGSIAIAGTPGYGASGIDNLSYANGMLYCNGTTDYIEAYCYVSSTVNTTVSGVQTHFEGFLARAA